MGGTKCSCGCCGGGGGRYPRVLRRPLKISVSLVFLAFVVALLLCGTKAPKNPSKTATKIAAQTIEKIAVEETAANLVNPSNLAPPSSPAAEANLTLGANPAAQENLANPPANLAANPTANLTANLADGEIPSDFFVKFDVFFGLDSAENGDFDALGAPFEGDLKAANLIVLEGFSCDIGPRRYNETLIAKRLDFARHFLSHKNPGAKILTSAKPQIIEAQSEEERQKYRKVSIYLYK